MDVTMAEPSPMSIQGLSLSPRRTAAAKATSIPNSKNIFAAAAVAQKSHLQHELPMPLSSIGQPTIEEEEEDGEDLVPDLPSPTRVSTVPDPVKAPIRPGLIRQQTAPTDRHRHQTSLFTTEGLSRGPSPPNVISQAQPTAQTTTATGSPTRKAVAGETEMFRKIVTRNLNGRGRTLVELDQARVGANPLNARTQAKGTAGGENNWG